MMSLPALDTHQAVLDAWFAAQCQLTGEYGGRGDYLAAHRHAVLAALALGLVPPDWPDYLDFMREPDWE